MIINAEKNTIVKKPTTTHKLLDKDYWLASELGFDSDSVHSYCHIKFTGIKIPWLKYTTKRFVLMQSATKTYNTCKSYIQSISRFDKYVSSISIDFQPENLNRQVGLRFIQYLAERNLSTSTRLVTLYNLRTFHQNTVIEEWLPFPTKPIIYDVDLPKHTEIIPRYIPDYVLKQLKHHLHYLPEYMQRFVVILWETGRRISEICTMPFNCLEQDEQSDWFLRVCERKMKKNRLIPISDKCVKAIKSQQDYLNNKQKAQKYLFPPICKHKSPHLAYNTVYFALNKLAKKYNITDINGSIWHFTPHQFRHTLATTMINAGVAQIMIQKYLGHESPEMTARYAHIHNETMKIAFEDYQDKLVDIKGDLIDLEQLNDAQWLKANIASQSLPNGLCTLPISQQRCPHANACLTCANFRTSKKYLEQHKKQLAKTCTIIDNANKNGWQRVVQANHEVSQNLKTIICKLENE